MSLQAVLDDPAARRLARTLRREMVIEDRLTRLERQAAERERRRRRFGL